VGNLATLLGDIYTEVSMKAPLATKPRSQRNTGLPYCDTIAQEMVDVAHLTYQDVDTVRQEMQHRGFKQFHYFDRGSTQAFLVSNTEKLILIFRGTELKSIQDWIANSEAAKIKACGGRVHLGFWEGCQNVWPQIETEIQQIRYQFPEIPLFLTGHSLGGALAILAAVQLQMCGHKLDSVYTFGCPRIGDRHFAMQYNRRLYDCTFRLVNHRDIVAQLPPTELGYTHIGQLIYFDSTGIRRISPFPQDNQFGWAESFDDHDLNAYKQNLQRTQAALLQTNKAH
jgi:triacylglycerol lipase